MKKCFLILVLSALINPLYAQRVNVTPFDTIWVPMTPRELKITVDKGIDIPNDASIGSKDFGASFLGCCVVRIKAANEKAMPASLFILHGDNTYNGVVAFKKDLSKEDEVIDWRTKKVKIVESIETQLPVEEIVVNEKPKVDDNTLMRIGMLEGKEKDRFSTVAVMNPKEKLILKLGDSMQDDKNYYLKFVFFNESKIDYEIDLLDLMYKNVNNEKEYRLVQESEKLSNKVSSAKAKNSLVIVYAIPKYNITNSWQLVATLKEKGGTRNIVLPIPFEKLNDATKF